MTLTASEDLQHPQPTAERAPRRHALLAWLGTLLLMASVAHGSFETTDSGFTMHAARSIWLRGDSALRTEPEGGQLLGEQLGAAFIKHWQAQGARSNGKVGQNGLAYVWFPMGHVFLMVPFVALGEQLRPLLPDADQRLRAASGSFAQTAVHGEPAVTQGLISLLVPGLCFATSILLLFWLARVLGASGRDATCSALAIGFASQAFAVGREQLSDGPGLMLLLLALLPTVRLYLANRGGATGVLAAGLAGTSTGMSAGDARLAFSAGTWSGLAVLMRYQTAFAVIAFAAIVVVASRRRRSYRPIGLFVLGGAPWLLLFLATNYLRFGNPLDTGYPEIGDWFQSSPVAGMGKLLFAAGRGILWLSPLLWLGLPAAARRIELRWLAWLLLLTPLLIFMTANGWQGGQAWAIRYVTPGVVALLAIALPQSTPWRRWPKLWLALVAAGAAVSLTSVVAPVRGQIQLMDQALRADEAHAIAAGEKRPEARALDTADVGGWQPRYSPLYRNWLYAWHSLGDFEDEQGRPLHDGKHGTELVYGTAPADPSQMFAPRHWTDRSFRHLWWRFWGDLYGVSGLLLVAPVLLLGMLLSWFGWRGLAKRI
ncbi:MAG: hypothetical protein AB8H80_21460 [Planctomycetota bacterium]